MSAKDKTIINVLLLALFGYLTYQARSILPPFIFSIVIAYFLNPVVSSMMHRLKLSRLSAVSIIVFLFLLIISVLIIFLAPIIYRQLNSLILQLPHYINLIINKFYPNIVLILSKAGIHINSDVAQIIDNLDMQSISVNLAQNVVTHLFTSSVAIINFLSLIFVTPILVFYLLKDWNIIVAKLDSYIPVHYSSSLRKISKEIDSTLFGYVLGQAQVCVILAFCYSLLLTFTGLDFGFLIGALTGFMAFIPYIGMTIGFSLAIFFALLQWGLGYSNLLPIIMIFIIMQLLESNFLTPKLIGAKIGLHPAWIIFGLFFFAALLGFCGIILAMPLIAISCVLVKNLALIYKKV